jgi:hypothetical protein
MVGNAVSTTLEEYKATSIGDGTQPNTATYICEYQKIRFKETQPAFTEPGIFDDFVWIGNQIICDDVQDISIQVRNYFIEFAHVPTQPLHVSKKTKAATKGGKACRRPQIYTIVEF